MRRGNLPVKSSKPQKCSMNGFLVLFVCYSASHIALLYQEIATSGLFPSSQ